MASELYWALSLLSFISSFSDSSSMMSESPAFQTQSLNREFHVIKSMILWLLASRPILSLIMYKSTMIYQESRMLPDLTWFDPDWSSPLSKRTPQSDSTKVLRVSCSHPLLTQFNMSNEGRLRGYSTSTLNNYTTMQQAPCLLHHPERLASAPFRAHTDTAIIGETYV